MRAFFIRFLQLALVFQFASIAIEAAACPQLDPKHKYVLLRGETVWADGSKQGVVHCVSRENGTTIVDQLDLNGKAVHRSRYEGIKGLSNEEIGKKNHILTFSYSENRLNLSHPRPGDKADFILNIDSVGRPSLQMRVSLETEKADAITISSCKLQPFQVNRRNIDWNGNTQNITTIFSPEVGWPIRSDVGQRIRADGTIALIRSTTAFNMIAPIDEAQRVCAAAQAQ